MRSLTSAAVLLALAVGLTLAQPATTTSSAAISSLVYLASPDLHKELKLDADQVKQAKTLASGMMTRVFGARADAEKRAALEKEAEKDLAFLKPEQRSRLREVQRRQQARIAAADDRHVGPDLALERRGRRRRGSGQFPKAVRERVVSHPFMTIVAVDDGVSSNSISRPLSSDTPRCHATCSTRKPKSERSQSA